MSLSTHVLDAALGQPAAGVAVRWESRSADGSWTVTAHGTTDADGRVSGDAWRHPGGVAAPGPSPAPSAGPAAGRHRLVFDVEGRSAFFPEVTVTFDVAAGRAGERHHVPLLLSPYAYSTYRGS